MAVITYGELPNEPIFIQLLEISRQVKHPIIRDHLIGFDVDYSQFLGDLIRTRGSLRESLPRSMFNDKNIITNLNPYIFILTDGGYEFTVAAFSILSIGGAFTPLSSQILLEEALNLLSRCQSTVILASPKYLTLAKEIQQYISSHDRDLHVVQIYTQTSPPVDPLSSDIRIDADAQISPDRPGMLLWTSGTSGPPKGVVHLRRLFYTIHAISKPNDIFLNHRSHLWVSGILPMIRIPLAGACLEIISPSPEVLWERLRAGGATILLGKPHHWTEMMRYFKDCLCHLPSSEVDAYIRGARSLRFAHIGAAIPPKSLLRFWRDELGRPLTVGYGSTEMAATGMVAHPDAAINIERCIGRPVGQMVVKLSEGDHGEILVKSPANFSHYIGDDAATYAAFTEDGFYKTGDIGHRVGDDYVIDGRASNDFVKCRGYKVSILHVETHLLELPFIQEGCILPVQDPNISTQIAALIRLDLSNGNSSGPVKPSLNFLRSQLGSVLSAYMLPTALRVLREDEVIPRTISDKVIKSKAIEQYFPLSEDLKYPSDVELWVPGKEEQARQPKAWDWAGLNV